MEKERKKGKFILIRIAIVLAILMVFIFLFCLPDLIISLHDFLYLKLHLTSNIQYNPSTYIQMVISIFSCCITAVLGYSTFFLTKILRNIETQRHNAKLATAAFKIYRNIKHNSWIIFNAKRNEISLDKVSFLADLDESWFVLSTAGEINSNEIEFLKKYNKKIQEIDANLNDGIDTKDLENKFCNYILYSDNEFEYSDESKKIIEKLENIMNRRMCE